MSFGSRSFSDSEVDHLLELGGGHTDKGAIIGLDGSKWTTDGANINLKVSPAEAVVIGRAFESGDFTTLQSGGLKLEGLQYQFLRGDDDVVLAKKKDHGAITMQKTKKAIVIGHTKEGGSQGNTNKAVAIIAEYLESLGM